MTIPEWYVRVGSEWVDPDYCPLCDGYGCRGECETRPPDPEREQCAMDECPACGAFLPNCECSGDDDHSADDAAARGEE